MSWKAGLSRYLPALRFFACPDSPSSRGVMSFYVKNYEHLKLLNPNFQLLIRTSENAMPAITTELAFTKTHLLRFMIQTNRFLNIDGTVATDRIIAAKKYLSIDQKQHYLNRYKVLGFDPENPRIDTLHPDWKENVEIQEKLAPYFETKKLIKELEKIYTSGPNNEYRRSTNALLMCQRIDLWCAGECEVERAVQHLYRLGRSLNEREMDNFPSYILNYHPGSYDIEDYY